MRFIRLLRQHWLRLSLALSLAAALGVLSGCFTARYVSQAAWGELQILAAARPIPAVVADPHTPPRLRRLLEAVSLIKQFGRAQGLRPTENYRSYADLHRRAAVWVVEACAPLAFEPKQWHFPVVGGVPYLGFFHESTATRYAAKLHHEGLDVDVRAAGAFSTLGWFNDPVLSTMIPDGPQALGELANTVLHESLHATLYIDNQSTFDESLANFVGDRLSVQWLEQVVGPDAAETRAYVESLHRYRSVAARLHQVYLELDALYQSSKTDVEKLAAKSRILAAVRAELSLAEPLNNATLMDDETYDTGGPAFGRLLEACGGSWPRLLATLETLRPSSFAHPQQQSFGAVLERLTCVPAQAGQA